MNKDITVLIVEDTPMAQMLCRMTLDKIDNISYEIADDGQKAFDQYMENHYNLILMDIGLPILNGIEATKKIRTYEKENNLKPAIIIALTANKEAGIKDDCFTAGMDDYLTKPLSTIKVSDLLNKHF